MVTVVESRGGLFTACLTILSWGEDVDDDVDEQILMTTMMVSLFVIPLAGI